MVSPCVVLVINDNPYGLMFALSYTCRVVHRQCLKSICWIQEGNVMTKVLFKGISEEWS